MSGAPHARLYALQSALKKGKNRVRNSHHVSFTQASHELHECEIPEWADFTKSVRDKAEVRRAT
eukprot:1141941-Alexandrium_andersonii.AAC.1